MYDAQVSLDMCFGPPLHRAGFFLTKSRLVLSTLNDCTDSEPFCDAVSRASARTARCCGHNSYHGPLAPTVERPTVRPVVGAKRCVRQIQGRSFVRVGEIQCL